MKVLIACEYSGIVRDAFKSKGHDAISCDLLTTDKPGKHYQGDVFDIINDGFDLMIAHPPCTFLTCAAEWAYKDPRFINKKLDPEKLYGEERKTAREQAVEFFMRLAGAPIEKIAIENPVGVMSTRYRQPDQFINPHQFGHDASKKTGLWLKGLPLLQGTETIEPRWVCCGEVLPNKDLYGCPNCNGDKRPLPRYGNQTNSGQNREPPGKDRWKIRSTTWQGWADAMAETWG